MPSPVGHALGAVATGWIIGRFPVPGSGFPVPMHPSPSRRARLTQAALLAAVGVAPDLDLLVGRHSMESHSIGVAVLVGALAAWGRWPVAATRLRIFFAVGLAWLSHPLLDMLALDTSAPLGVMFFWPFSTAHLQTGTSVFAAISRRYWLEGWVRYTALSVAREIVILAPLAWLAWRRTLKNPAN